MSITRAWFDRLYAQSPGYWTLVLFKGGKVHHTFWMATDPKSLDKAARTVERKQDQYDFYSSVGTWSKIPASERSRGTARDVISLAGLWADIDIGTIGHKPAKSGLPNPANEAEAMSILDGYPEPSSVVHTGGGLHVWYFFEEPWVFGKEGNAQAAATSKAWQRALSESAESEKLHLDSLPDLTRILRIPGSQNHKAGLHRPVVLTKGEGWFPRYEREQLVTTVDESDEDTRESAAMIEDSFPLSWADILTPHGWKLDHTDGADVYWRRPGKLKRDGHSAVAHPNVFVNWSESAGLPTGEGHGLNKLQLYAKLNYAGDMTAARKAIAALPVPESKLAEVAEQFAGSKINWPTLWNDVSDDVEWLCEPLIEVGKQITIYSEAKDGKSLLLFELCLALSQGWATLGNPSRDAISIVYVDRENTHKDLHQRGVSFGYKGQDFPNLAYYSFPDLSNLDTPEGGRTFHALAKYHSANLVVIDTTSRVVQGEEKDNETYINFYKHTGVLLKASGIAMVRLDHQGKDIGKSMRGASSKKDDVDAVWHLVNEKDSEGNRTEFVNLRRTHTRSPSGSEYLQLVREDDPLRHVLLDQHNDNVATAAIDDGPVGVEDAGTTADEQGQPSEQADAKRKAQSKARALLEARARKESSAAS